MPPRLPRITANQTLRALQRDGWYVDRQSGSHAQLKHLAKEGRITIPMHPTRTLGPRVIRSIINQAGLSVADFIDLL